MAYKLNFTPTQAKFIQTGVLFTNVRYSELVQIWKHSGGEYPKVPSSLIKKLERLGILDIARSEDENIYNFNNKKVVEIFTRVGLSIALIPDSKLASRHSDKANAFEQKFEAHDQFLYKVCLNNLAQFKGYEINFPKERNIKTNRIVPDAIYRLRKESDYFLYLEFDNLTEGSIDFSSKLPRYIQYYQENYTPEIHTSMSLIFVFNGEPLVRISHLLAALSLTRTVQRTPVYDWLKNHKEFNVYFLTEGLWQNLGTEIANIPYVKSPRIDSFNVLKFIDKTHDSQALREHYKKLLNQVSSDEKISEENNELSLFNTSDYELPNAHKKLFT